MRNILKRAIFGLLTLAAVPAAAQKVGDAMMFDGVNDYLVAGSGNAQLNFPGTAPFTIECWVYLVSDGRTRGLVTKETTDGSSASWGILLNSDNKIFFRRSATLPDLLSTVVVYKNTWTHIACTYDGATMRIYKNSVADVSVAQGSRTGASTSPVVIGGTDTNGPFVKGGIDEVRIWNFARTQAQIASDFGTALKGNESGLVALWRIDAVEDLQVGTAGVNDLRDSTVNAFHVESFGGPTVLWRTRDWDRDAIPNTLEATLGTDPYKRDTDSDGVEDGVERALGYNPLSAAEPSATADADLDLLPDAHDTEPSTPDRDFDGHPDGLEVALGTDPSLVSSRPTVGDCNNDGSVDFVDAVALMSLALQNTTWPQNTEDRVTDLDRSGRANSLDAVILFNYYLGNLPMLYSPPG